MRGARIANIQFKMVSAGREWGPGAARGGEGVETQSKPIHFQDYRDIRDRPANGKSGFFVLATRFTGRPTNYIYRW